MLTSEAVQKAVVDLPHVVLASNTIMACFLRIQVSDDTVAKSEAFDLYLETPSINGLLFFTALSLADRETLIHRLGLSCEQTIRLKQLAFFFHHKRIRDAFAHTAPSFHTSRDFSEGAVVIPELLHAFTSEATRRMLDAFGPWLSDQKIIDWSQGEIWKIFVTKMNEERYDLDQVFAGWVDYLSHLLMQAVGDEFTRVLSEILGVKFSHAGDYVALSGSMVFREIAVLAEHDQTLPFLNKEAYPCTIGFCLRLPWRFQGEHPTLHLQTDHLIAFSPQTATLSELTDTAALCRDRFKIKSIHMVKQTDFELLLVKHAVYASIYAKPLFTQGVLPKDAFIDMVHWQAEFRSAVLTKSTQIKFIGMPQTARKPVVNVGEIYVPQYFRREAFTKIDFKTFTAPLSKRDSRQVRWVVLGAPGMGKTTLFLYVHALIAEKHYPLKISLLFTFRDFVASLAKQPDLTLMDYFYAYCQRAYGLTIPKGFFEYYLSIGRCVVLFDGMDEVGAADQRSVMRAKIQAFIHRYPHNGYLISSRIAGYAHSSFPRDEFQHHYLEDFDAEEIQLFIRNWYDIVEANNVGAGEEGARALTEAVLSQPRVLGLARNPLLLTLMALIHRYEAVLPQERHVLYEKCIELLLQSWMAGKQYQVAFEGIPLTLQRKWLEDLAYHIMRAESAQDEGNATISEARMTHFLVQQIDMVSDAESFVGQWLDFMKSRSGILVEQQPGLFSFMHLTFLEYLCACAVIRQQESKQALVRFVRDKSAQPQWRETLLLIIAKRASDGVFLERLSLAYEAWWRPILPFGAKRARRRIQFFLLLSLALEDNVPFNKFTAMTIVRERLKVFEKYGETDVIEQLSRVFQCSKLNGERVKAILKENILNKLDNYKYIYIFYYYRMTDSDALLRFADQNHLEKQYLLPCAVWDRKILSYVLSGTGVNVLNTISKLPPEIRKRLLVNLFQHRVPEFYQEAMKCYILYSINKINYAFGGALVSGIYTVFDANESNQCFSIKNAAKYFPVNTKKAHQKYAEYVDCIVYHIIPSHDFFIVNETILSTESLFDGNEHNILRRMEKIYNEIDGEEPENLCEYLRLRSGNAISGITRSEYKFEISHASRFDISSSISWLIFLLALVNYKAQTRKPSFEGFREAWYHTSESLYLNHQWKDLEKAYFETNDNLYTSQGGVLLSMAANIGATFGTTPNSSPLWHEMTKELDPDKADMPWLFHLSANLYKYCCEGQEERYAKRIADIVRTAKRNPEDKAILNEMGIEV